MSKYRTTTLDTYLIDAATLTQWGERLYIAGLNRNITVAEMQAALNAQYGKGIYQATSHGSARYVMKPYCRFDGEPEVNSCEQYLDGSYVHKKFEEDHP